MLRSGTSIGANYREAYRGRSKAEFIAKCGDSLREIEETAYWLELIVESGIVTDEKLKALRQECDELTAIFITIIKKARSKEEKNMKNNLLSSPGHSACPSSFILHPSYF